MRNYPCNGAPKATSLLTTTGGERPPTVNPKIYLTSLEHFIVFVCRLIIQGGKTGQGNCREPDKVIDI